MGGNGLDCCSADGAGLRVGMIGACGVLGVIVGSEESGLPMGIDGKGSDSIMGSTKRAKSDKDRLISSADGLHVDLGILDSGATADSTSKKEDAWPSKI